MIRLIIVRNPFDVHRRETRDVVCRVGMPIHAYFNEPGRWQYAVNGRIVGAYAVPRDGDFIVVIPYVGRKALGIILTLGLSFITSGIAAGAFLGHLSMGWRMVTALAVGMIGGSLVSRLNAPRIDRSNANLEQSPTYGWSGTGTLTGQGHPLAVTYGAMKSGGGLLSRHIVSDGQKQYLSLLYCAGEGELSDIRNIRINENPIGNYKGVQIDVRYGTNDQKLIPNFDDSYADQPLNYTLTGSWSTHEIQGNAATGIEFTIALPNGLYYSNDSGGMDTTGVHLFAECRIVGSETEWMPLPIHNGAGLDSFVTLKSGAWVKTMSGEAIESAKYTGAIREATNKGIFRAYRFEGLPPGRYEVRLRASKDGESIRYVNAVYWTQLTQIIYDDFIHPGKALVGIRALATEQLSGSDPTVTWVQERAKVYVWNPYKRIYEEQAASNPAWACYDILHQCRRIDGRYEVRGERAERIGYDAFKAWAEHCAAAGYAFNFIYDSAMQLWEALRYPETVGRGKVIMQGTRFTCIYDCAAVPTQLFTVGNIKQDSFKEEFQGTQGRANAVEISFMNAAKNYERDVLPVFGDDYDATDSLTSPTQIELMGCTDVKQAYKHGKHALRANKYELRTCTFEAFVDAIACTLGDVILLQHDVTNWGSGGRIVAAVNDKVTLDRTVTMEKGRKYRLMVRDGKTDRLDTYEVKSVSGDVLTLTQAAQIAPGDIYTFGEATKEAKPFRVLAITKGMTEQTRKITCMEYYPELYAGDDTDVPIIDYTTQSDALNVDGLSLVVAPKMLADGTTLYDINVSWRLPRGRAAKQIRVMYRRGGEKEYTTAGTYDGSTASCVIAGVATAESYTVAVVCINDAGVAGKETEKTVYTTPKETRPAPVRDFKVEQDAGNSSLLKFSWRANSESDIRGYRLSDSMKGVCLDECISGTSYTHFIPASGRYSFDIFAINRSGRDSSNWATASIDAVVSEKSVAVPDAPKSAELRMVKGDVHAAWDAVTNTFVDFYEVRKDDKAGQTAGLLAKTTDIRSVLGFAEGDARSGAVFIYAHNPAKGYGAPLSVRYDFPQPAAPIFSIKKTLQGFNVDFINMPSTVKCAYVALNSSAFGEIRLETFTSLASYTGEPEIYQVNVYYADVFGDGVMSEDQLIGISDRIPQEWLDSMKVGMGQVDDAIRAALEKGAKAADNYVNIVGRVDNAANAASQASTAAGEAKQTAQGAAGAANSAYQKAESAQSAANKAQGAASSAYQKAESAQGTANNAQGTASAAYQKAEEANRNVSSAYSAITQLRDAINLRVVKGDVINQINVSGDGIKIDGRFLHITGRTLFDAGVIASHIEASSIRGDRIVAGSIGADRLRVTELSAVAAKIGVLRTKDSGARTEIRDNLILVYDDKDRLRVRMGVW